LFRRQRKTKQKQNTICAGHHYAQTSLNKANKTRTLIQITGDRDEPNIVFMRVTMTIIWAYNYCSLSLETIIVVLITTKSMLSQSCEQLRHLVSYI
jgi:hypothetical protein